MELCLTLSEGQQQQGGQPSDDSREQENPTAPEAVDGHTDEDAGQGSGDDPEEVAEVEAGGVTVQVPGEAVLNACSNEPGGDRPGSETSETSHWTCFKHIEQLQA